MRLPPASVPHPLLPTKVRSIFSSRQAFNWQRTEQGLDTPRPFVMAMKRDARNMRTWDSTRDGARHSTNWLHMPGRCRGYGRIARICRAHECSVIRLTKLRINIKQRPQLKYPPRMDRLGVHRAALLVVCSVMLGFEQNRDVQHHHQWDEECRNNG